MGQRGDVLYPVNFAVCPPPIVQQVCTRMDHTVIGTSRVVWSLWSSDLSSHCTIRVHLATGRVDKWAYHAGKEMPFSMSQMYSV